MVFYTHMAHAQKTIHETVTLAEDIYSVASERAKENRVSVSEYLSRIVSMSVSTEYVEIADEATEKAIAQGRDDIRNGRGTIVPAGDKRMLRKVLWGEE